MSIVFSTSLCMHEFYAATAPSLALDVAQEYLRDMAVFEVVIAVLLGGAILAAIARRVGAPYPALVALAGAALALVPGVPTLVLDPELALALFVAPVLLDARSTPHRATCARTGAQ